MTLRGFLARLIGLCMLPLIVLAGYLSFDALHARNETIDREATQISRSVADLIDQNISARIRSLQILARSPDARDPARWKDLYSEALSFQDIYEARVVLADAQMRPVFSTQVPFGSEIPPLPDVPGRQRATAALWSGKPFVTDIVQGPMAKKPVIAIAVPGMHLGRVSHIVIASIEAGQYNNRLERSLLPEGWALSLRDSTGAVIASRVPPHFEAAPDVGAEGRFSTRLRMADWRVVVEIPRDVYYAPLINAGMFLLAALLAAIVAGVLGASRARRRLAREVGTLTHTQAPGAQAPTIREIAVLRQRLDDAAHDRASAERALRESERRFRVIFEQAAIGIAILSPDGRWLSVNPVLCETLGYSEDELRRMKFQDLTHPDDLAENLAMRDRFVRREASDMWVEKRYIRKDGSSLWARLSVAIVRDEDDKPQYFVSVVENIDQRKRAESALRESEAALREAQSIGRIGNWSWHIASNRHQWSVEIYRILGHDPRQPPVAYPEVQSFFTPGTWPHLSAKMNTCLAEGRAFECDVEVVRPDGSRLWATVRATARRSDAGRVTEIFGTMQDITERRRIAEELRELNATLEQRVAARTAELTALNRELDSFAYAVSHDLRAPLRSVAGFAKILDEDHAARLDDEGRDALARIRNSATRMGELIEDLLQLSRLGNSSVAFEPLDLVRLARPIVAELVRQEPARTVEFVAPETLPVDGDRRLLTVLLENLLANAWKFTGKCTDALIEFGVTQAGAQTVYFIRDNGAGFDMQHAEKLFTPFQRLHSQTDFPGTGIGLATVRRVVQRHGGRIWADATPGQGATFYFTLAAKAVEEQ